MKWKKVSPHLCRLLDKALVPYHAEKKQMFGCPAYFVNGNMFAGVHQDSLFVRLSAPDRQELFDTCDEAARFEPMAGRIMREYVVLPESLAGDPQQFDKWLQRSFRYVSSLPMKEKKGKP